MTIETAYLNGQTVRCASCKGNKAYGKTTADAVAKLLAFLNLREWTKSI